MTDSDAEQKVKSFYEGTGWDTDGHGDTLDAQLWEDLRPSARAYVSACRRKILKFLPKSGDLILDAASGPIQYPEYLEYSRGFNKRICVDISSKALEKAKEKLQEQGETVCSSILDLPFPENHFDAVISLHTIYHIDKDRQEDAVLQLLRVSKPAAPIVIIYSNPDRLLSRVKRLVTRSSPQGADSDAPLYFFAHPLSWWKRFEKYGRVTISPWRSLTAADSKRLIPDNSLGKLLFSGVLKWESVFPRAAASFGAYPMIILTKCP